MRVVLWGNFGSLVSPGPDGWRLGGNTTCVEVTSGPDRVVLDAGVGIVPFGDMVTRYELGRGQGELHLLFTHLHWDHILGLPFFTPVYIKGNTFHLYGASEAGLRSAMDLLFDSTYSPINGVANLGARLVFSELTGEPLDIGCLRVTSRPLTHPGGCLALRVDSGSRSFVLATDHEAGVDLERDRDLVELARGADVLVHDAQFRPEEYEARRGWGHSPFPEAVKAALAAGVRTLVLFHHDPNRSDDDIEAVRREAEALARSQGSDLEVLAGRDRMLLELG